MIWIWTDYLLVLIYVIELRNEGLKNKESGSFIDFSIASLWLDQET